MTYEMHIFELIFWVMIGFVCGFVCCVLMGDKN